MKKTIVILFLALTGIAVSPNVTAQNDKKAASILDAMSNKYKALKSFQAIFTYTQAGEKPLKGDATVKGTMFKLKLAGQEIFNDGKTMATFIRETNEVNIQDFDPNEVGELNPTRIYSAYKKGFKYSFIKETTENGQVYEEVQLAPTNKTSQVTKVNIKVNKKDKSIKSWKVFQKNGQEITYNVERFVPNIAVADNAFTFNAKQYPGVEVVDLR